MDNPISVQISVSDWLKLPAETRKQLAEMFNIPRSKGVVMDFMGGQGIVQSDGHTQKDLEALTLEKMQDYLQHSSPEDTFASVLVGVLDKYEKDRTPPPVVLPEIDVRQVKLDEWANILARLKVQSAEYGLQVELKHLIQLTFPTNAQQTTANAGSLTQKPKAKRGRPSRS